MKLFRNLIAALVAVIVLSTSQASALPVTALDYSGDADPGVAMEITAGSVFQTAGAAALSSFLNWGDFLPAADAIGKVKITNVALTGTVTTVVPGVYTQATSGGKVEAFDLADNLLLSVDFTVGQILLTAAGTGGQFTAGVATFGGALASYFVPTSATHSVSFVNWNPVQVLDTQNGAQFATSGGYGNGLIAGEPVPEPATMLLLGSGVLGMMARRRRA